MFGVEQRIYSICLHVILRMRAFVRIFRVTDEEKKERREKKPFPEALHVCMYV